MTTPRGPRADSCPGVLTTHQASDGRLARVRLPGGRVSGTQLAMLADAADDMADGVLYLTSRGNIQLRGLPDDVAPLGDALAAVGLLPSGTHERVRNYLASPASGCFGGQTDVRPMVRELDNAVCSHPDLKDLSGRFLFAVDDGRSDVATLGADLCWQALDADRGRLIVAGVDTGLRVESSRAVEALVCCAEEFVGIQTGADAGTWRVKDVPGARQRLAEALAHRLGLLEEVSEPVVAGSRLPLGATPQEDGRVAVCAAPVLGELSGAQARLLPGAATEVIVTPWRTVFLANIPACDAEEVGRVLAESGIVVDPQRNVQDVSACIGAPACAKANADVRTQARSALDSLSAGAPTHIAGCERRCGKPAQPHNDVVAQADGYLVNGSWVSAATLTETLADQDSPGLPVKGTQ